MWRSRGKVGPWDAVELVRAGCDLPALVAVLAGGVVIVLGPRGVLGGGAGPRAIQWFEKCGGHGRQHHAPTAPPAGPLSRGSDHRDP